MISLIAAHVASTTTWATDPTPADNNVVAGWVGFAVFMFLVLAVVFLGFSLVKQLRKAQRAEDEGKYDPSDKKPRRISI